MTKKIERLNMLLDSFNTKRDIAYKKADRARKPENYDRYYEAYRKYAKVFDRALNLRISIRRSYPPDSRFDYENRIRRKEEKRQEFISKHRYSMWFFSNSVCADYGTFTCDRCGRTFYHSPSTIYKGGKTLYRCCCGRCTNDLIHADHGCYPYE